MENHTKSPQYSSRIGPWRVLGAFSGLKGHPKAQKAPQKGRQGGPRAPLGSPRGTPRAPKGAQREPRESPRALLGGLGRGKIEKKSVTEAKKVDFSKSAPRLAPADARSTLDPPKQLQNRPRMLQIGFLSPLGVLFDPIWSLQSGLGALGDRSGSTPNA